MVVFRVIGFFFFLFLRVPLVYCQIKRHFPKLFRGSRSAEDEVRNNPKLVSIHAMDSNRTLHQPRNMFQEGIIHLSNDVWTQDEIEVQLFPSGGQQSATYHFRQKPSDQPKPNLFHGYNDNDNDNDDDTGMADSISLVQTTVTASQIPVITGSIHVQGALYQIRQLPGGDLVVDQRGRDEDFDDEIEIEDEEAEEWVAPDLPGNNDLALEVDFAMDPHRVLLAEEGSDSFSALQYGAASDDSHLHHRRNLINNNDDGSRIDIMIVYSRNAMCAAAKQNDNTCQPSSQNKATIEGIIELAVKESNEAFEASNIPTKLRLVKVHFDDQYDDTQEEWPTVFSHFTGTKDGHMDYVHAMRDQYGADFVSFIVNTRGYCGSAHRPKTPNPERAFSMVRWDCATGHYTFTHELAHTLGCRHDLKSTKSEVEPGDFNFGFQYSPPSDKKRRFRTLMAYNCPDGGCQRILRFSNPKRTRQGVPLGNVKSDNSKWIRSHLRLYASFRPSIVLTIPKKPQPQLTSVPRIQNIAGVYPTETRQLDTVPYPGSLIGAAGNMFEVVAKKDLKITGFSVMAYAATTAVVEVYKLSELGSFVGNERNPQAWQLIGGATLDTKENKASALPFQTIEAVEVSKGETQSFYVTFHANTNYNRYSRASQFGDVFAQNDDIQFKVGYTANYPFTYHPRAPRVFNGEIFYEVAFLPQTPSSSLPVPSRAFQTTFSSNNGYAGNLFTIEAKTDLIIETFDINAGSREAGLELKIYTKHGDFDRFDFQPSLTWFELCSTTVNGQGESNPTHVPASAVKTVAVKANDRQSFFITFTGPYMKYTSALLDPNYLTNDDLSLVSSAGTPHPFTHYFPNRIWNGVIYYQAGSAYDADLQGIDTVVTNPRPAGRHDRERTGSYGAVATRNPQ
ncbi:Peptidyl-Asp metalloendopeptidase [Seminavis robusta]|uniref:Peptidyl-Asp metalloendopeptidase n=1 Tax=Seminavis robusta TaxID=568900 RepID=A0A9N8HC97_9STRA|nr:Peptidyl-Asp metalloendopeptidase [Seminavis robusta]|eukprot:Sro211_g087980.1 Peptidyl-Asp metalloendopeptidase (903) ;mRNA; f:53498-56865